MVPEPLGPAPAVDDLLAARAAVGVDEERVLPARVEVARFDEVGVQRRPVGSGDGHELRGREVVGRKPLLQVRVVHERRQLLAARPVERGRRRRGRRRVRVDEVVEVAREVDGVPAGAGRDLRRGAAVEGDAVEVPLQRALGRRRDVGRAVGLVDAVEVGDVPLPARDLADEVAVVLVEVEVAVPVAVAPPDEVVAVLEVRDGAGLYV